MGGRDEEFAEYVELRWSLLYRFATEHAGEERAEAVARAGLLAAYDVWPDVVESGSRDLYVEQLVLDQIAAESRPEPAVLPAAGDDLPPLPPVEDLLAEAHRLASQRRRRRARVGAAVVAALAAAAVLVAATDENPTRGGSPDRPGVPSRMSDVPVGTPPRTPYTVGAVLDFGPAVVALPRAPLALAKAGSDLVITYPGGRIELFDPVTRSRSLLAAASVGEPVVDLDGHWVAWRLPGARPGAVVAASLLGSTRYQRAFPVSSVCCDESFVLHGITGSGQLIASNPTDGLTWVWNLEDTDGAGPVRRLEGLGRLAVTQVVAEGVVLVDRSGRSTGATVGTVFGDTFEARFSTQRPEADFAVPGWIVYTARDGTLRARTLPWAAPPWAQQQREVTLRLPAGLIRTTLRRELGTTVVMDVRPADEPDPRSGYLVRCDIATGSCQNVARLVGPHRLAR